jgi:hypothetical protein
MLKKGVAGQAREQLAMSPVVHRTFKLEESCVKDCTSFADMFGVGASVVSQGGHCSGSSWCQVTTSPWDGFLCWCTAGHVPAACCVVSCGFCCAADAMCRWVV